MTIEELQGRKPLDGLADWLRSQCQEYRCAPWHNDAAVRQWIAQLDQWASEVVSIQAAITQPEEE